MQVSSKLCQFSSMPIDSHLSLNDGLFTNQACPVGVLAVLGAMRGVPEEGAMAGFVFVEKKDAFS